MELRYSNGMFSSSNFSCLRSDKLNRLLDCCFSFTKNDSRHDRLLSTLSFIAGSYGHILPGYWSPAVQSVSLLEFADAIEKVYSLEEPRNHYCVSFLRELDSCIVNLSEDED
jgi:hypothetical protein